MILDLDAVTRNEVASMCYARWSNAWTNMKTVKAMVWDARVCPKSDWPEFHAQMLAEARRELDLAEKLKADVCPFSPLVIGS